MVVILSGANGAPGQLGVPGELVRWGGACWLGQEESPYLSYAFHLLNHVNQKGTPLSLTSFTYNKT